VVLRADLAYSEKVNLFSLSGFEIWTVQPVDLWLKGQREVDAPDSNAGPEAHIHYASA